MTIQTHIYAVAQRIIDTFGEGAAAYADARMKERLFDEDHPAAAAWLAIGSAIDDLDHLPPPGGRH